MERRQNEVQLEILGFEFGKGWPEIREAVCIQFLKSAGVLEPCDIKDIDVYDGRGNLGTKCIATFPNSHVLHRFLSAMFGSFPRGLQLTVEDEVYKL